MTSVISSIPLPTTTASAATNSTSTCPDTSFTDALGPGVFIGLFIVIIILGVPTKIFQLWQESRPYDKQYQSKMRWCARVMRMAKEIEEKRRKEAESIPGQDASSADEGEGSVEGDEERKEKRRREVLKRVKSDLKFLANNVEFIDEDGYVIDFIDTAEGEIREGFEKRYERSDPEQCSQRTAADGFFKRLTRKKDNSEEQPHIIT